MSMKLAEAYVDIGANMAPLKRHLLTARRLVGASAASLGKAFTKAFVRGLQGFGRAVKRALKIGLAAGVAGLALAVRQAVKFEEQMAQVSTMLDKMSARHMPAFTEGIKEMAVEFGQSTAVLSKGLYDILSASIAPAKALEVLRVGAKAAVGGFTDTAVAVDAITSVLNAYQLSASEAGDVSDWLFSVVKRGKTTFPELGSSIGRIAVTAAKAGVKLEDLGTMIAVMTRAGISTSEVMSALNAIMQSFLKPADASVDVAKKFGIELSTAAIRAEGFVRILQRMEKATAEEVAAMIPQVRGLKGVLALLGDTEGAAKDYATMIEKAGAADMAFAKGSDTMGTKLRSLSESIKGVLVTFGEALMPKIELAATSLTDWLGKNKGVIEGWATGVAEFLHDAVSWLMKGVGSLMETLGGWLKKPGLEEFGRKVREKGEYISPEAVEKRKVEAGAAEERKAGVRGLATLQLEALQARTAAGTAREQAGGLEARMRYARAEPVVHEKGEAERLEKQWLTANRALTASIYVLRAAEQRVTTFRPPTTQGAAGAPFGTRGATSWSTEMSAGQRESLFGKRAVEVLERIEKNTATQQGALAGDN